MRKQVDFDVRVFPLGNGANDTMTRLDVAKFIREDYLLKQNVDKTDKSYWEVTSTDSLQVSAGVIYFQVTLIKFLDV